MGGGGGGGIIPMNGIIGGGGGGGGNIGSPSHGWLGSLAVFSPPSPLPVCPPIKFLIFSAICDGFPPSSLLLAILPEVGLSPPPLMFCCFSSFSIFCNNISISFS